MRIQLRDLSAGQDYAIQFRSVSTNGASEWSQVQRFTTTNDTIRPGNVQNLSWYNTGNAFVADWDKVTVDENGNALRDFRQYRCNVTDGTTSVDFYVPGEHFEFSKERNESTFGSLKTSLTLRVYAVDMTYNESNTPATVLSSPANPPTPSTPVVSSYLGLLMVSWDGKDSTALAMPANFNYAEVHVSTTSNFTPSTATFVGRLQSDGSASKMTVPGLTAGTVYYVRLIAVNLLAKKSSAASAQASGTPGLISGLDIADGALSTAEINFTAKDIGGANAYYSNSAPVSGTPPLKQGDIWYNTTPGQGYATSRYSGSAWVLAPEIGVISGTKILAGTVTADAIATNFFTAYQARIGTAFIDSAMISTITAAQITTGSIQANQKIIAGDANNSHSEMTSTGFYVMGPDPSWTVSNPTLIPIVKMGTGSGDTFSITNPNNPDQTLASISGAGKGSFQDLSIQSDPVIIGRKLIADRLAEKPQGIVGRVTLSITGLEQSGANGIREEYGIGSVTFPCVSGRSYKVTAQLNHWYLTNGGEVVTRLRDTKDLRTPAQIAAGIKPTQPTVASSRTLYQRVESGMADNAWQAREVEVVWHADYTGYSTFLYSMVLNWPASNQSVIKIPQASSGLTFVAEDLGITPVQLGQTTTGGAALYSYTAPSTPPPSPPPTYTPSNYYWEGKFDWAHSYKGTDAYMSGADGKAYQGQDPSGSNGNTMGQFGFNTDFISLLNGATVTGLHLYLYYAHWYYNAGGTARIGYHNVYGDPGSASRQGGIGGTFDVSGWPKPGGMELDILGWAEALKNGNFRGILLGPGNNGYENYGYAIDCVIKLWYSK